MKQAAMTASILLLALAVSTACGPAKAEPLEVTYYYLPG